MKKILTVIGARPQFIKSGILSKAMLHFFEEVVVHTGQHYDTNMSDVFFDELALRTPKYNLNVGSLSHAKQTAEMMIGIEEAINIERPDGVLVYGDTNSTLAAALAASKLLLPVFHVEGGIRTHCMDMPEEQNRVVTDHLSSMIFVSTNKNLEDACSEGLKSRSYLVGDIMYDSLIHYSRIAEEKGWDYHVQEIKPLYEAKEVNREYYFATIHRPENTDETHTLKEVLSALNELEYQVILATHPRIDKKIANYQKEYENIYFIEPLSYLQTLFFTKNAKMVVTDSGGLHKEAYLHGTPCVTILRSGWNETVKGGWNSFVRPDKVKILQAINHKSVDNQVLRDDFGNGKACQKIVDLMIKFYSGSLPRLY